MTYHQLAVVLLRAKFTELILIQDGTNDIWMLKNGSSSHCYAMLEW